MDNHYQGSECDQRHMTGNACDRKCVNGTRIEVQKREPQTQNKPPKLPETNRAGQSQEALTKGNQSKLMK